MSAMKFTHKLEAKLSPSFRAKTIAGMFDLPLEQKMEKQWEVDIPIEDLDWSIGMIIGSSGSGKTTIAKAAFPDAMLFDGINHLGWESQCLVDDFDESLQCKDITNALSQVGFSSPPQWLLPFSALSNGQKFRAEMAKVVLETKQEKIIMIDEFTSVIDRDIAKICSCAVQKMVRRNKKKMIAISCHSDIAEWLEPDWVYNVDLKEFKVTRGLLRRPKIEVSIKRVHHSSWELFKGYHYLSGECNKSARCYVAFINDKPVAFAAAMPFPHPKLKNMWRGHRTVVLPDYQGIGLGNLLSEHVAQILVDEGKRYSSVTSHPAMVAHRANSKKWIMTRKPGRVPPKGKNGKQQKMSTSRLTASFEYVGERNGKS